MNHFDAVPVRTPNGVCAVCHKKFERGDRRLQVSIVAGIGRHPYTGRPVVYANDFQHSEWAHVKCDNPKARRSVVMYGQKRVPLTEARDSDTRCPVCDVKFQIGDRIVPTFIVLGQGVDPETKREAAVCHEDFEHVHKDCSDPQLSGGGPLIVTS